MGSISIQDASSQYRKYLRQAGGEEGIMYDFEYEGWSLPRWPMDGHDAGRTYNADFEF